MHEAQRSRDHVGMFGIGPLSFESTSWEDRSLALVATLLPIAVTNLVFVPFWTVRMALVLVVLPLGLVRLVMHARSRDRVSIAALAFMAACALTTVIARAPLWNLRGGFGRESSLVFVAGFFAIWSVARTMSPAGRVLVAAGSMVGLGATGAVAIGQFLAQPSDGLLATIGARPSGLLGNPVYFGACVAGGAALAAHVLARRRVSILIGCLALVVMTGLVNLSGSRAALLGVAVPIAAAARRAGSRRLAALIAGSAISGILATALMTYVVDGRGTTDRVFESGGASSGGGRLGIWGFAWSAFKERPFFGHGLGQFRAAIQPHFDPAYASRYLADTTGSAWPDAHNLIVQYSVVGGVVALVPLGLVIYWASRDAHGPCAWAVVPILLVWLTQPANLATAPLAAVWLGLAMPSVPDSERGAPTPRALGLVAVVGMLLATALLGLGVQLERSLQRGDVGEFRAWARVAPDDPVVAATASTLLSRAGARAESATWAAKAAELEPHDAVTLARLAVRQYDAGDTDGALESITTALEVDRYNPIALATGELLASAEDDETLRDLVALRTNELAHEAAIGPEGAASDDD